MDLLKKMGKTQPPKIETAIQKIERLRFQHSQKAIWQDWEPSKYKVEILDEVLKILHSAKA